MIQPSTPIQVPAQTGDGLWITSLSIMAPSTSGKARVVATVAPFSSVDGQIFKSMQKTIVINDLFALAAANPVVASGMSGLFAAVQTQVTGSGLF